jgi:hypothetical protein
MEHKLVKLDKGFQCEVCRWTWTSSPVIGCPGVVRYSYGSQPDHLKSRINLHKQNLKPKVNIKPAGAIYLQKKRIWIWLFDEKDCELDNPDLPQIYQWDNRGDLQTIGELRKQNLAPCPTTKPDGVGWIWDGDEEWGKWIPLYWANSCQWQAKDSWLTKSTLRQKYLLSPSWIKRLGECDRELDNPRWRNAAPIQLYSRQRVESFLAENAEAYTQWLDKREQHIAIFEANREKIFRTRNLAKEQTVKCLQCASGVTTSKGFLCAIHPMGLDVLPCRDWSSREKQENFPASDSSDL